MAEQSTEQSAEVLQALADQYNISVEAVEDILRNATSGTELQQNRTEQADAMRMRDEGMNGRGRWIPGGGVYVGRGLAGLGDIYKAYKGSKDLAASRAQQAELLDAIRKGLGSHAAGRAPAYLNAMGKGAQLNPGVEPENPLNAYAQALRGRGPSGQY